MFVLEFGNNHYLGYPGILTYSNVYEERTHIPKKQPNIPTSGTP